MENIDVLVVDDEAIIREGLRRILEKEGYHVETSASGQIALERLQDENYGLVITDLKMPGMSGMEVLKAIKVLQPEVPVIIITGFSTVDTAVEAMKNGAFDYIAKPFTPDQITEKVRKALEQRAVLLENILVLS
ncbi:hypothetical protein RW64_12565 [Geobacter sulfurreducens]|nr:hypothetical protein RW64_12565 [Geobacter sulfurreducens]